MSTNIVNWGFLKEMVMPNWSLEVLWNKLATTFHCNERSATGIEPLTTGVLGERSSTTTN